MARPNIVFLTSHDIGRQLGCYGHPEIRTPHLDALAAEGAFFRQAFCTQPQCSPARASLYTGRYPHSHGVMGLTHGHFGWDLHPGEVHIAGFLKGHGYQTGGTGVEHSCADAKARGLEHFLGGGGNAHQLVAKAGELLDTFAKNPGQPFYLQLGFFEGHRQGPPDYAWPSSPEPTEAELAAVTLPPWLEDNAGTRREYVMMHHAIARMDTGIGELVARLKSDGLWENTILVFAVDHGIAFPRAKTSCYEAGLEIAAMMRGPGVPTGFATDALVSGVDFFPTLAELAGLPVPANVQGESLLPLFRKEKEAVREHLYGEMTYHNYPDPIRSVRDGRYKLLLKMLPCATIYNSTQQWAPPAITSHPKNPKNDVPPMLEFYDLQADPHELHDLAEDATVAPERDRLLAALGQHLRDTADPILDGLPLPPRFAEAQALLRGAGA